jgi:hypothetical protein
LKKEKNGRISGKRSKNLRRENWRISEKEEKRTERILLFLFKYLGAM